MDVHGRYAAIDGRRVHWREWGDPEAEPLVFLHGSWLAAALYDTFAERLAATRHVFALDQRGHGETDHAPDYSWQLWLDDIAAFVDHTGLDTFDLVGHSMGASHAARFASLHPDRMRKLVLVEGGYLPINSPQQGEYWTTVFRLNPEDGFESRDAYVELVCELFPRADADDVRAGAAHFMQRPDGRWHWPHPADPNQVNRNEPTGDQARELHQAITAPTLVVQTADSELFVGDAYAEFARTLANGQACTLPAAGHNLQWENVAGSTALILDFLDR